MTYRHILLLLLPVLFGAAQPARAAVIEVFHFTGCTLHDAINAANGDTAVGDCPAGSGADTIRLVQTPDIGLETALPKIESTITIESADTATRTIFRAVSGAPYFRLLDVDDGSLTLRNVTLSGGYLRNINNGGGAGVRVRNGSLLLEQCVLKDNRVSSTSIGGGAILSVNSTVDIVESRFEENTAMKAIRWLPKHPPSTPAPHGGGIYAVDSAVSIRRSSFIRNDVLRDFDETRAVHFFRNSSLTVEDSYFEYVSDRISYNDRLSVKYALRYNSALYFRFEGGPAPEFVNSTFDIFDTGTPRFELGADSGIDAVFVNNTIGPGFLLRDGPTVGSAEIEFVNTIFLGLCLAPFCQIQSSLNSIFDETDLFLYDVADNGGPTLTRELHPLSAAVNNGNPTSCPPTDQRGEFRGGGRCDIGAFELLSEADIQVSAVPVTPAPYYVGQTVRYDINIFNDGPSRAHYIEVDADVQNATLVSVDGYCSALPCTIFELGNDGPFRTIELELMPFANGLDQFTVTASASPGPDAIYTELDNGNNISTSTRNLSRVADLEITKTLLDSPPYFLGQRIDYQIQVTNLGPDTAQSLVVTDTPDGLSIEGISNCGGGSPGPCTFASLAAGNTVTLDVDAEIAGTEFDNAADVTAAQFDPDASNNLDRRSNGGSTENDANLRVRLSPSNSGPYLTSGFLDYTVEVVNGGPDTATNVEVDFAPDSARYLIYNVIGSCGATLIPCELGNIPVGGSAEFTVQGQFLAAGPVGIEVLAEADQNDADPENNEERDTVVVAQAVDLWVSLELTSPPPYFEGVALTYEAVVSNIGFQSADNVVIEAVPENLVIDSVLGTSCMALPCTVPTIGTTETIELVAVPQETGSFDLTLSGFADQVDTDATNNVDASDNGGEAGLNPEEYLWYSSFEPPGPPDL